MTHTCRQVFARAVAFAIVAAAALAVAQERSRAPSHPGKSMKIQLELEGTILGATLEDSTAARDFASLLPLTLTLKDHAATEKVADLPKKLSTQGAPAGIAPEVGDIAYYAPWGNLALFYQDFGYSAGLVRLGKIDSGVAALRRAGPLRVTIRRAAD